MITEFLPLAFLYSTVYWVINIFCYLEYLLTLYRGLIHRHLGWNPKGKHWTHQFNVNTFFLACSIKVLIVFPRIANVDISRGLEYIELFSLLLSGSGLQALQSILNLVIHLRSFIDIKKSCVFMHFCINSDVFEATVIFVIFCECFDLCVTPRKIFGYSQLIVYVSLPWCSGRQVQLGIEPRLFCM